MKKFFVLITSFFIAVSVAFSQTAESPIPQMDEAVGTLARNIHAKLVEKKAEKITVGQFTYQDGIPPFSSYWVNQLVGELTNMSGRNYSILSSGGSDAEWTIVGEIVQAADIVRIYSRLIRLSDRSVEASFSSTFQRNEHINDMIAFASSNSGGSSSGGRDSREPDSWDSPVTYTIGSSANVPAMNRALTDGDEDFFLLVPDRSGRLTAETTGSIDTYMQLFNYDDGDELASNDDGGQSANAKINFRVRSGTRYLAIVRGYGSSTTGAYGFKAYIIVREGASSWDNPVPYEIGIGEDNVTPVSRNIQQGDEDYFLLVPDRDGRLTVETTGRIDTYIELYQADDEELLDENDDGGQNSNARIRYSVSSGVRYIAMVRGYSGSTSGSYGFRAFFQGSSALSNDEYEPDDEPSQAKPIEIGEAQQHSFHSGDDVDWVKFQIRRAGQYNIHTRGVNSNRLDTYIELYDSNMNQIAEDDDGGSSLSSLLTQNLNSGTYYLKVWCLDEEPDQAYTIKIDIEE